MWKNKIKISRVGVVKFLVCLAFLVVAGRLFVIQIIDRDYYAAEAKKKQQKELVVSAERGKIYLRDGDSVVAAVVNMPVYMAYIDPMVVKDREAVYGKIVAALGEDFTASLEEVFDEANQHYFVLANNLSYEKAEKLRVEDIYGIRFKETYKRVYVEGDLAAQTLGFVNSNGVGYGVEASYDKELAGEDGVLKTLVALGNVPLSLGDDHVEIPAKDGQDIYLTIDRGVQSAAEKSVKYWAERYKAEYANAVVLEAKTGRIVAMANYPSFNPEEYGKVSDATLYNNPILTSLYEPASVMKTFSFAAAVDMGVMNARTTYKNNGYVMIDGQRVNNAFSNGSRLGTITMQDALSHSLNTGSVEALRLMGGGLITVGARENLYDYYYNKFHLGQSILPRLREEIGWVRKPDIAGANVTYANMTFGQGLSVNMLQVASGFSAVVNTGVYKYPYLVEGDEREGERAMSTRASDEMREMLEESWATASGWIGLKNKYPDYKIGAKSGTAQVADLVNGGYKKNELVGSYIGYVGRDLPEYVIMTRIGGGGQYWGWDHASPMFKDIIDYLIREGM